MNFGKKWLALILVVTLLCTLCACTGKVTEKTPTVTTTAATTANGTTVDTTAAPTDGDETTTVEDTSTTATVENTSATEGDTTTATEATALTTVSTTTATTTKKPVVTTAATTKKATAKTTQKTTATTKKTTAKTTQKTTATTKKTTAATKPTAAVSSGPDGVHNDVEYEIFRLLNEEREKNGLQPLLLATQYHHLAEIRAEECVVSFSHTRPDGTSCFSVLGDDWGTKIFGAGENIAAGYRDAASVHLGWKNSPGHYANMVNPSFNAIAIAVAYDENGRAYYCELFVRIA